MLYKDFEVLIGSEINVNDCVYICDYRFNDINSKAIRHVKPQKVAVISNDNLPKNKRVYYSHYHFRSLNSKGLPSSKIIAPYDNTGYRSFTGISLNIFLDENECKEHYKKQCEEIISRFEAAKVEQVNYYNKQINEITKEIESL